MTLTPAKIIPSYIVDADHTTGEWIEGTLYQFGVVSDLVASTRMDTPEMHFDTFEHEGQTCAIAVRWVD